jgi:hypothetical protein
VFGVCAVPTSSLQQIARDAETLVLNAMRLDTQCDLTACMSSACFVFLLPLLIATALVPWSASEREVM